MGESRIKNLLKSCFTDQSRFRLATKNAENPTNILVGLSFKIFWTIQKLFIKRRSNKIQKLRNKHLR
jgi:cytosine/uracil/thiamine/allantoin permease